MSIGPFIRSTFGPYEARVSEFYRSMYLDIESLIKQILQWQPSAKNILEVGCGEGAVTERLSAAYPDARITGIDVTPRVGRLYRGSSDRVRFIQRDVQEIAATEPRQYDLVVLCDVLHHVPVVFRKGLLDAVRATLKPGGAFVFKDWERNHTPIHWLCYASDRWLTGDRVVYLTRDEMREILALSYGATALVADATIAPWRNNVATLIRP